MAKDLESQDVQDVSRAATDLSVPYSHILIPTTLTHRERSAILLGLQMASAWGSQVSLLHVASPTREVASTVDRETSVHWLEAIDNLHQALARPRVSDASRILDDCHTELLDFLDREIPIHLRQQPQLRRECRLGDPAEEILSYLTTTGVDLLILPSDLSGWLSMIPSAAHRLLQQAPCHVILVQPDPQERSGLRRLVTR